MTALRPVYIINGQTVVGRAFRSLERADHERALWRAALAVRHGSLARLLGMQDARTGRWVA